MQETPTISHNTQFSTTIGTIYAFLCSSDHLGLLLGYTKPVLFKTGPTPLLYTKQILTLIDHNVFLSQSLQLPFSLSSYLFHVIKSKTYFLFVFATKYFKGIMRIMCLQFPVKEDEQCSVGWPDCKIHVPA